MCRRGSRVSKSRISPPSCPSQGLWPKRNRCFSRCRRAGAFRKRWNVLYLTRQPYAPYIETEFAQMDIPCYIDRTRKITLNPMIEYIKSALELYRKDFSYESVFHYLRSGLADLTWEEADRLENYCLETGVKGYSAYSRLFTRKTREMKRLEEEGNLRELPQGDVLLPQQGVDLVQKLHHQAVDLGVFPVQRFYLYLNMTKPSRHLYLSWSKVNSAGKSIRPTGGNVDRRRPHRSPGG